MILQNQLPNVQRYTYDEMRPLIKSGDILLCSGRRPFSRLIQKATRSIWSHVAFILYDDEINEFLVLESVESKGVRAVTLKSYTDDYNGTGRCYEGDLLIARHADFKSSHVIPLSKWAASKLGHPYDYQDIAKISARLLIRGIGIKADFKMLKSPGAYICSEFWGEGYQGVGISVAGDDGGFIVPSDIARAEKVKAIGILERKR
jgi:uncharacterized protein YycO